MVLLLLGLASIIIFLAARRGPRAALLPVAGAVILFFAVRGGPRWFFLPLILFVVGLAIVAMIMFIEWEVRSRKIAKIYQPLGRFLISIVQWSFDVPSQVLQPCPPLSQLQDLVAERLPPVEQEELNVHLETCTDCQHRLEGLVAGQGPLSGLGRHGTPPLQHEPALKQVMDSLKRYQDPEPTGNAAIQDDLPLGFLSPPDKPEQLGRLGSYEVLAEIGRGGMGVVLKAFDPTLQRIVAIKVLAPQLATSGVARKRFTREAQAAAAVNHENVVTIHAVNEARGLPYLVMEFVPGYSLQDRIDRTGPLELKEILRIGMQTAAGLAAAHAQGLIHRDIKPANILLENGIPRVKITDFGLARAADDAGFTQSGVVAGTPQFMAPEQARGETVDHRADLFSLGSTLYAMCTGRPPFRATTNMGVLKRVSDDPPPPIRDINPDIPTWLVAIIEKLHAKNPANRFQTATEVSELLAQHLALVQQPAGAPIPAVLPEKPSVMPPPPQPSPPPLTSLTICPSCGANLHVPERLVGQTVYCVQCGNPFRPQSTVEEIHVVPAVFAGASRPRMAQPRSAHSLWARVGFIAACLLCLVAGVGFLMLGSVRYDKVQEAAFPDADPTMTTVLSPEIPVRVNSLRTDALSWFPADVTFFGAIDFRVLGPLQLNQGFAKKVLDKLVTPDLRALLAPNKLGTIRIERIAFAYRAAPQKGGDPRFYVRFTGAGDLQSMLNHLREQIPGLTIQELRWPAGPPVSLISSPDAPAAFALVGARDVVMAGYARTNADHIDVVKQMLNVRAGYEPSVPQGPLDIEGKGAVDSNPIRAPLGDVPLDSWAFVMGDVPSEFDMVLRDLVPQPPSYLFAYLSRATSAASIPHPSSREALPESGGDHPDVAADLSFRVDMKDAEGARALMDLRVQGLDALEKPPPTIKLPPQSLELLRHTLRSIQMQSGSLKSRNLEISGYAVRGVVTGRLHVTSRMWNVVTDFLCQLPVSWRTPPPN
jgi:serine/threonine-protein kinase